MTNLLILYINNLVILGLSRFTLIMNDDKSSGDTTLTYKKGEGFFCHLVNVYIQNESMNQMGFPKVWIKFLFRSAKIISSMYTYKPGIKVAIHTCIIMHNTSLRSAFLAQRMKDLSTNQDNAP